MAGSAFAQSALHGTYEVTLMLRNALLLLTLAVLAPIAFAQTTWNGGTSTNWGDAANWSAGVPTAATDAIISGTASTMPTLNVAGSCLSLTINSGATLNAGAQTLTVNGNWTNNGTFTAGTSNVIFGGTATATVGGTAATSFYKVTVTKGALATTVTQNAAVTTTLAGTSDSLDIQVGTWVTNGQNLTVAGRVNSTGTATGELRVTVGGTVNLNNIYGWNLDYFTVQAGTVNISGLHEVVNSGHRCDFTGGVVNYTNTGTCLQLYTNNTGWGWYASGTAQVNIAGSINTNSTVFMQSSGSAIVRFTGATSTTVRLTTASWSFVDLRIEKTGGASVTFTAGTSLASNFTVTNLTVNAGAVLNLGGTFNAGLGFAFTNVTNNGTINQNAYLITQTGNFANTGTFNGGTGTTTFNGTSTITNSGTLNWYHVTINTGATVNGASTMNVMGNWTKNGTFNHSNGTVVFTSATTSVISGTTNFFNFTCTTAGKQITFTAGTTQTISGTLTLTGTAATTVNLRSSATGTKWFINDAGNESCSYVNVQDSTATNSIVVYPGGVDNGNNTNWLFTADMQVAATAGTAQNVVATDTGPSGAGRSIGTFTITNTHATNAFTLNSITLEASGSGNDSNAYSEIRIFEDTNLDSTWNAGDTPYAGTFTVYPADNGTLTFTAAQNFPVGTSRRYFVVVKLGGTTLALNGHTFNTRVSNIATSAGGVGGVPSTVMNGLIVDGPELAVASTAGTAQNVYANSTGTGSGGISAGTFTITANAQGAATLNSITITASGTGNDSNAFSEVRLYEDTGGTAGSYDPSVDTPYGSASTAFPADNGSLTFSAVQNFTAGSSRRYFVVVKLNGSTLATPSQTFNFAVTDISVSAGVNKSGLGTPVMNGLVILAPAFTFADASPATQGTAYPSSGDYLLQKFTVNYAAGPNNSLTGLTVAASGSGNDSTGYASVRLYRDANANGNYDAGVDTQVATQAAFSADNGTLNYTLTENFTAGATNTYFIIGEYNGTVAAGNTFQTRITAATYGYSGTTSTTLPAPASGFTAGVIIAAPTLVFADNSSATQANAYLSGSNFVIQQFTVNYPAGPNNTLTSITVTASGTGDDLNDYASVALYRDVNSNATYDVGVDAQVNSVAAFSADNGTLNFTLAGAESQFTAGQTKQYFIVVAFNNNGTNNTTFSSQVTAASGQLTGTTITGMPQPSSGPTAGLLLLANNLSVTFNGPGAASTVNNNDQGTNNEGLLLFDCTLSTVAGSWTVTSLTFTGKGTANHQTAYSYLALFEDTNGNGTFDGATGGDNLAVTAAGVAFNASNEYTAALSNTAFPPSTTRRFFLVGKLAGTATTGQTLNAQLTGHASTPPSGGLLMGIPTSDSTALIIDTPVLTTLNSPSAPATALVEGGSALSHTLGLFNMVATNNNITVNGVTLTTMGTGDWVNDLTASGVELYLDNGNGVYDGAPTDTLLFSGAGANGTMTCTFSTPVNVANNSTASIWIRLNVAATAGASVPETFIASIANAGDVNLTGGTSILGTPAPMTNQLRVVLFAVTSFSPTFDLQTGGAAITITGSGFLAPLTLTIGGVLCTGTPVIGAGNTQITGFIVPPGTGNGKAIVLTNGPLGAKTLTQTFNYAGGATIGTGPGGGGGGGCSAGDEPLGLAWLAALALLAVAARMGLRGRKA